ncbi:hypothetical protein [Nocardia rhizosphaerae]|uniref:Helix-turn-helix domain-containing protein n=1 Tax=Nocardia rhizosphaerae TaxID=1691571 RepID=A0ABV8L175_9NOCA
MGMNVREGQKQLTQEEVDDQPLMLGVPALAALLGLTKQRVYLLLSEGRVGLRTYRINSTRRFSTIEVLRSVGDYDTTELEERLMAKPMYSAAELSRMFGLSYNLVRPMLEEAGIKAIPIGAHPRYSTAAIVKWLGVEPDRRPHTPASTSSEEPGISSCVKTKGGKPIHAGKPYRYAGRVYDGADIIAIAQLLGVA